jgi:rhodanese-related sulfurtransferase
MYLVDVRKPAEFREGRLPTAINLPSTQSQIERYHDFADRPIFLV